MLRIYADALEVVRELVPYVAEIDRQDPDLARRLKKARSSILLNVAEGSHARGARRNLHYGYAKGSANECIAVLESAHAAGHIRTLPEVSPLPHKHERSLPEARAQGALSRQ